MAKRDERDLELLSEMCDGFEFADLSDVHVRSFQEAVGRDRGLP